MKKTMAWAVGIASLLLLGGCATPKVDASKFSAPKTVVIDDIPDIHSVATIEVVVTNWPAMYFNGRFDRFYTVDGVPPSLAAVPDNTEQVNQVVTNQIVNSPRPVSVGQAAAMGAVGGLVGGLIQASAEDTQKRAAEFPALMRKTLPGDLRTEVMQALRESLEAKGIQVRVAGESRTAPLRLHWPGKDADGKPIPTGRFADGAPVDADLLIQVAPVALYAAPGPLNSYHRRVGIGLALFNGRTREFIGWQAFPFKEADGKFQYMKYDSLVADLDQAGPALRSALLSLVPEVVKVVSGDKL